MSTLTLKLLYYYYTLQVNGKNMKLGSLIASGQITSESTGLNVIVRFAGVAVHFDKHQQVEIVVPSQFKNKIRGWESVCSSFLFFFCKKFLSHLLVVSIYVIYFIKTTLISLHHI